VARSLALPAVTGVGLFFALSCGGIIDSAQCCACLANYAPDGSALDSEDPATADANCIAGAFESSDYDDESDECSDEASEQITGEQGRLGIPDARCIETVCATECETLVEEGMDFVVFE